MKLRLSLTESLLAAILPGGIGIAVWQTAGKIAFDADEALFRAVRQGVPRHHWPFGNMPPVLQVTGAQIPTMARYVRELQETNSIFYRPHQM